MVWSMIILAAIWSANCKNMAISISFCDLAKVYNSVCQELLYIKLQSIKGQGGLPDL